MPLVLVEWLDSFGCSSSWQDIENVQPTALLCKSVGWLLFDGPDCKVIVPHLTFPADSPQQGCGDMTIPARAITQIRRLA